MTHKWLKKKNKKKKSFQSPVHCADSCGIYTSSHALVTQTTKQQSAPLGLNALRRLLNNKSKLPSLLYNTFSHSPVTPDTVMMQYQTSKSNPCSEGSCTSSKCFCYGENITQRYTGSDPSTWQKADAVCNLQFPLYFHILLQSVCMAAFGFETFQSALLCTAWSINPKVDIKVAPIEPSSACLWRFESDDEMWETKGRTRWDDLEARCEFNSKKKSFHITRPSHMSFKCSPI